jgi:hypothetical protein
MLSRQEEEHERRAVLKNDARVRERQGTTFHQFAQEETIPRGRFTQVNPQLVVAAEPVPNYPAAAAHQHDPCGIEPPLGYSVDAMPEHEPLEVSFPSPQATGEPTAPSSTIPLIDDVERVGSPLSSKLDRRF